MGRQNSRIDVYKRQPYGMFVRPLDMFMEEVEDGREDNITNQKYRFELYDGK